ncbi:MAG: TerC family protein [Rhodocyclaceae bacterium]
MLEMINAPGFWVAVLQIVLIDIVLSGDNAVVIALACRNLPAEQRRLGILWGVVGAVGLRVALTLFAVGLLGFPWLKLGGGVLLLWIGIQLLVPEGEAGADVKPADHLIGAIRTIIIADFVMSLDNVIGVAAAAKGNVYLLGFGLLVSIPLIVWSSQLILKLMERFPVVIVAGAGLLGWVAGEMMVSDLAIRDWLASQLPAAHHLAPALGALAVVVAGKWMERRSAAGRDVTIV